MRSSAILALAAILGPFFAPPRLAAQLSDGDLARIQNARSVHEAARIEAAEKIREERERRIRELEDQLAEIQKWTTAQFELGERGVIDKPHLVTESLERWQAGRELEIYKSLQFPEKNRGPIESGEALNMLLDRVGPAAAQNLASRRLNPEFGLPLHPTTAETILDEATFNRLMIADNIMGAKDARRGSSGLIDLDWPAVLREAEWAGRRGAVEEAAALATAELVAEEGLSPESSRKLRDAVGEFNQAFNEFRITMIRGPRPRNFSFEYARVLEGTNHLRRLVSAAYYVSSARKIYDLPSRPKYVAGNVEEFLHYMTVNNLRFERPAEALDRKAYHQVFDMMVRYYLDQAAVTNMEKKLQQQLADERDLSREAMDVALGKTLSAFDQAALSIAELKFLTELVK